MINHPGDPLPLHVDSSTGEILPSTPDEHDCADPGAPAPFSTPSYSAVSSAGRLVIAIGGEYAAVKRRVGGPPQRREWKRGKIKDFSARSRSRLLQKMAQTDYRQLSDVAWFVTLTWPRYWPDAYGWWKDELEAFRKRLVRDNPHSWFIWRLEFQKRGAPHIHLIVFNAPDLIPLDLKRDWHEIVGSQDPYHLRYGCDVKQVSEWKQVGRYVSKYAAKVEDFEHPGGCGRVWGIGSRFNRAESIHAVEIDDATFYRIRRIFKRIIRAGNGYYNPGGPTSGVWARVSNRTAKRALEFSSSAPVATLSDMGRAGPGDAADSGKPWYDIGWSNSGDWTGGERMTTDRRPRTSTTPLFDSLDCQRRAARLAAG